jgi:hypothetical protein
VQFAEISIMPVCTTARRSAACGWGLLSVDRHVGCPARVADALFEPLERGDERAHDWLTSDNALNCADASGDAAPLTTSPLIPVA